MMRTFIICTHHQILLARSNQVGCHTFIDKMCTKFQLEYPMRKDQLVGVPVDGFRVLKWILHYYERAGIAQLA